mgnify:FL=1
MSFLNRFQYHYHEKQLESLSSSNKHEEILSYLEKLSDKNKIFHDLSLKYADNAINKSTQDVSKKQIVWINSFLDKDKKYLETFLESYLSNFNLLRQSIKSYQEEIDDILINQEKIDFDALINHSYFFQWLIINKQKASYKFISNNLPFFSSENNFNFSKPSITQAYVAIVDHPYNVYKFIKMNNNNDQEIARNIFLNLDQKVSQYDFGKSSFYLSKKGWHTNTQSWIDANVLNSLKGKIISKKELDNNTYEVLSSIILHLIQSGVELDLDYELIEQFVKNNPSKHDDYFDDISTKEMKFLDKYVFDLIEAYELL